METLATVLEYAGLPGEYLGELSIRKRVEVLSQAETADAVDYLRQLDKAERNMLIELMDEHISGRQKLFLIAKEARIGLVNGLILGSLSVVCIGLYLALLKGQPVVTAFSVSLCTGAAHSCAAPVISARRQAGA